VTAARGGGGGGGRGRLKREEPTASTDKTAIAAPMDRVIEKSSALVCRRRAARPHNRTCLYVYLSGHHCVRTCEPERFACVRLPGLSPIFTYIRNVHVRRGNAAEARINFRRDRSDSREIGTRIAVYSFLFYFPH
jgi:hypothetical protein